MIEGELKNKFAKEIVDSEDFLTSTVFGLLKYTPMHPVLKSFLGQATRFSDNNLLFRSELACTELFLEAPKVIFWERDSKHGEPDVILVGKNTVLIIEVKLQAEMSGEDQLCKYHELLEHRYADKRYKHIIYLTKDMSWPRISPKSSQGIENCLWWVSWYDLKELLEKNTAKESVVSEISQDLISILDRRNLCLFKNFTEPASISEADAEFFWKEKINDRG